MNGARWQRILEQPARGLLGEPAQLPGQRRGQRPRALDGLIGVAVEDGGLAHPGAAIDHDADEEGVEMRDIPERQLVGLGQGDLQSGEVDPFDGHGSAEVQCAQAGQARCAWFWEYC